MNDIIEKLLTLKSSDLLKIRNRIDFILSGQLQKHERSESIEKMLFIEIVNEISRKTNSRNTYPQFEIFKKKNPPISKQLTKVASFLDDNFNKLLEDKKKLTKQIKKGGYGLFSRIISKFLIDSGIPLTLKTVLNNYDKFPALLDKAFPDYPANIILNLVIMKGNKNSD